MRILWGILLGGLIAGALDIVYAFVVYGPLSYGVSPRAVLQSVAAGWIGRDASRAGGWSTASARLGIALPDRDADGGGLRARGAELQRADKARSCGAFSTASFSTWR